MSTQLSSEEWIGFDGEPVRETITDEQLQLIRDGLEWIGFDTEPEDCDITENGGVWRGLTQVLPRNSVLLGTK